MGVVMGTEEEKSVMKVGEQVKRSEAGAESRKARQNIYHNSLGMLTVLTTPNDSKMLDSADFSTHVLYFKCATDLHKTCQFCLGQI